MNHQVVKSWTHRNKQKISILFTEHDTGYGQPDTLVKGSIALDIKRDINYIRAFENFYAHSRN